MDQNNELMETTNEINEVTVEDSGLSTKVAIAIGSALTLAVIGGVKAVKKTLAKRKAKKEEVVIEDDVEEEIVVEEPEEETN